jgi:AcrR family transcriptional regulator
VARLLLNQGVAETSSDAIAIAVGVSPRTIWRTFRNESCIEPLLAVSIQRFTQILHEWPLDLSLEDQPYFVSPPSASSAKVASQCDPI